MKLDEGEHIVDVQICTENDDVLLTTAKGQCIRFPVPEVRVFKGRDSMGVRGINLAEGDDIISMAILRHVEATSEDRALPQDAPRGHGGTDERGERRHGCRGGDRPGGRALARALHGDERPGTVHPDGVRAGLRQAYLVLRHRITGRGGKGITAMAVNSRNGRLVASFPVEHEDEIMLVTNSGQLIRVPVEDIRVVGRGTQGVTVFSTRDGERVVSVEHIEGDDAVEGDEPAESAEG